MRRHSRLNSKRGRIGLLASLFAIAVGSASRVDSADDNAPRMIVLKGIVVDEADKPVANAIVTATTRPSPKPVKTTGDGAFQLSIPSLPSGRIDTTVVASRGNELIGSQLIFHDDEKVDPIKVELKPAKTIEVRVVDRDGRSIQDAEIHFLCNLQQFIAGRSDVDGRWRASVPSDVNDWGVYALKSKIGFDYDVAEWETNSLDPKKPLPERLTLVLDGARPPLRVKTVDQNGKPLSNIDVSIWTMKKPGRAAQINGLWNTFVKTDAFGIATLDWLPLNVETGFSILANSTAYYPRDHAIHLSNDKPIDETTIALLPLEKLAGRVTTADGKPVADALIKIEGCGAGNNNFLGTTRSDFDGRYMFSVHSEHAFIITASKDDMVAPYLSGIVVRAGVPVAGANLILGRGIRVRGRVTVGKENKPVAETNVFAVIDKGAIPVELRRKDDRYYRGMTMTFRQETDKDGGFTFLLAPGDYTIQGPDRVDPVKLTIPSENPPMEIVRDFSMSRELSGPFAATVVEADGEPVAGAKIEGTYQSTISFFRSIVADSKGAIRMNRSLDPLVLHAETPDGARAAIIRLDAEAREARIVVKPTASASGRLTDMEGKPIAGRKLSHGIVIHLGPDNNAPMSWYFGGSTTTDESGAFRFKGLVVGEEYDIYIYDETQFITCSAETKIAPTDSKAIALGDVRIDLTPTKPYTTPTAEEQTRTAFAARAEKNPTEKIDYIITEARREYTRPMLLIGGSKDPACVDLFRLFAERSGNEETARGDPSLKSPGDLRWDFELA